MDRKNIVDKFLLNIVDEAWMECTESTEVPSTDWAERIIAKANIDNLKLICEEETHVDIDVKTEVEKVCEWKRVDNGIMGFHDYEYMTTCKRTYDCDKTRVENYCPNCGGKIK